MEVRVAAQQVLIHVGIAMVDGDQAKGPYWTGDLPVMDFVVIRLPAAADRVTREHAHSVRFLGV